MKGMLLAAICFMPHFTLQQKHSLECGSRERSSTYHYFIGKIVTQNNESHKMTTYGFPNYHLVVQ
jgi:hypothetical protein